MYIDEFVEDLSNCIGFISGDELILKKNRYDFEYEIITRNRDKKLGSIKWDTDYHCIVILLNNKSYTFDRSELTIEKTKEIGKMINKAYYNMNESFLKEFTNTYQFDIEWNTGDEYWDNFPDYDEFEGTIEGLTEYLNSQLSEEDPPANFDEEALRDLMDGKTVYDETGARYSVKLIDKVDESLENAKKLLKENGYILEDKYMDDMDDEIEEVGAVNNDLAELKKYAPNNIKINGQKFKFEYDDRYTITGEGWYRDKHSHGFNFKLFDNKLNKNVTSKYNDSPDESFFIFADRDNYVNFGPVEKFIDTTIPFVIKEWEKKNKPGFFKRVGKKINKFVDSFDI